MLSNLKKRSVRAAAFILTVMVLLTMIPMGSFASAEITPEASEPSADITDVELETVKLKGVVTDDDNEPIEGATVTLSGEGISENESQTTTNKNGCYEFAAVYVGKDYTLEVDAGDMYNKSSEEITIEKDSEDEEYYIYNVPMVKKEFEINIDKEGGNDSCTVESDKNKVDYGEEVIVTATASLGYYIKGFKVNGKEQVVEEEEKDTKVYTINNVTEDQNISVEFAVKTHTVTFTVGENGEVTYNNGGEGKVEGGNVNVGVKFNESEDSENPTKVKIEAKPNENYRVSKVTIDGIKTEYTENDGNYKGELKMNKDHSFKVEFSLNQFEVEVEEDGDYTEHGEAEIVGEEDANEKTEKTVNYGDNVEVKINVDDGYYINSILVEREGGEAEEIDIDSERYSEDNILTVKDITENTTITVSYGKTDVVTVDKNKLSNDDYEIIFTNENGEAVAPVINGENSKCYVPDGTSVTLKPNGDYKRVRINKESSDTSIDIKADTEIETIGLSEKTRGNTWTKQADVNIKIIFDDTAPTIENITKEPNQDYYKEAYTITVPVEDNESGVAAVYYSENTENAENTEEAEPKEAEYDSENGTAVFKTSDIESSYTYYVWAVDKVGNTTNKEEVKINIDTTAPTVTSFNFISESLNACEFGTYSSGDISVEITAADESGTIYSGVKSITFNEETKETTNGKAEFTLSAEEFAKLTDNTKEVSATVTDNAGNESEVTIPTQENSNIKSNKITIYNDEAKVTTQRNEAEKYYNKDSEEYWYSDNTSFNVEVEDRFGIKSVVIKMNGKEVINEVYDEGSEAVLSKSYEISTAENPSDGKNEISVEVKNVANTESDNSSASNESKTVYIDTTSPEITSFKIEKSGDTALEQVLNFLTFGTFSNEKVKVTVTAADENASSGISAITLFADGEVFDTLTVDENNQCTFEIPAEEILSNKEYFNAALSAKAADNVGNTIDDENATQSTTENSNIKSSGLMIETIAPTASVSYPQADNKKNPNTQKSTQAWYNSDVEFTVSTGDVNSGLYRVVITINGKELVNEALYSSKVKSRTFKVNTKNAVQNDDGSYKLEVTVTDNAGNVYQISPITVYKDTTDPYITGYDFSAEKYIEGSEKQATVEATDYGFYFKENTKVTVSVKDDGYSAGINGITYYMVDKDSGRTEQVFKRVSKDGTAEFTVAKNFKGQIYARASDNVGNVQDNFVTPNSTIVEEKAKHDSENHITFSKAETSRKANDNTELYASEVPVTITVSDTYSGIRDIEWEVEAPYDTGKNMSGKLSINNDKTLADGSDSGWQQTKTELNLVTEMKKTITVSNNSNDIVVKVKMTDRAGNTSEKSIKFSIDTTKPTIELTYDNNSPDSTYKDIYKANRVATVKITERNFSGSDVVESIKNTDGVIPSLSDWEAHVDSASPDSSYYTATISYTADGDYTFDIDYTDLAGNKADDFTPDTFTIDKTKPAVSVAYDNDEALNGNYYKADRTATVTIVEHNFDSSRVKIIGTAVDNTESRTFPEISEWTDNGDTHTAVIEYSFDSRFTFDIEFTDKAGNAIDDFTKEEFVVDKTAPTVEISGVIDKSANNGEVAPVITYSDTNFNSNAVGLSLVGSNNGESDYTYDLTSINNGQMITYQNFAEEQRIDDLYTMTAALTDMAGNSTSVTISFSVNRFGSVYTFGSYLKSIEGKYTDTEQDVVFTETNVDTLEKESIALKLIKNDSASDLTEGTDYTVVQTGGDGEWSQYEYTIKKELFANDGNYSVTVYSIDAAGNTNENIDEAKKAEISFGIDKTAPVIVPIDLESGEQYAEEVKTVQAEIKDNLVLEGVEIYLNGKKIEYTADKETYTFDIPESNEKQNVEFKAYDAAGNEYTLSVENVLVSTNAFVRWYNNTPLFIASIIGVVILAVAIAAFIIFGRKRKVNEEK